MNTQKPSTSFKSTLNFNFDGSLIDLELKERIVQHFHSMPQVLAQNDLDFGRTNKVKHQIKLSDETPFKHRARPIHANDLEAVRKHLLEL